MVLFHVFNQLIHNQTHMVWIHKPNLGSRSREILETGIVSLNFVDHYSLITVKIP